MIQIRHNNEIIQTKHIVVLPRIGDHIAYFSYNKEDMTKMAIKEFVVYRILHLYRDPQCSEDFISKGLGDELTLIDVLTPQEVEDAKGIKTKG